MAWTDIDLYKVNQLMNETALTALKGNIEYLNRPNAATYQHPGTGSNYTATGTLGQDIDGTNFNLSLTTVRKSALVIATFYGNWYVSGAGGAATLRMNIAKTDPISHIGSNMYNNFQLEVSYTGTDGVGAGNIWFFTVPAGTHEFRAVWGVSSGTANLMVGYRPMMCVWEA